MKRRIAVAAIAAAAGIAAVMASATPAAAASSLCIVGTSGNCTTSVVAANSTYHWVNYVVNNWGRWAPCDWRIRDVNSRIVVGSGTVGVNSRKALSIFGLYGYYQLELRGCQVSATGSLSNT
jgi:hypothetical protein